MHIISFDVPYPPNYGGVMDVYYKLVNLHRAGIKIILHCFEYGRGQQPELEKYCHKIYYYKRNTSFLTQLSSIPYIIKSRNSTDLINNLVKDNYPILFEGLHTCYYLNDPRLKGRMKVYRESNIEHHYYYHLAHAERNGLRKLYFVTEARRLYSFQQELLNADLMLVVSTADQKYLQHEFPGKAIDYLPSFHPYEKVTSKPGKGEYVLYHGNLGVSENVKAAEFLIKNVFSKIAHPVIIAGLNPSKKIYEWIKGSPNIQLIASPKEPQMQELLDNAHVHCLYTHQATGLKLKLLSVLYSGRFCVCNENMLEGTALSNTCIVENEADDLVKAINNCFAKEFDSEQITMRNEALTIFDNDQKTRTLIGFVFGGKKRASNFFS